MSLYSLVFWMFILLNLVFYGPLLRMYVCEEDCSADLLKKWNPVLFLPWYEQNGAARCCSG